MHNVTQKLNVDIILIINDRPIIKKDAISNPIQNRNGKKRLANFSHRFAVQYDEAQKLERKPMQSEFAHTQPATPEALLTDLIACVGKAFKELSYSLLLVPRAVKFWLDKALCQRNLTQRIHALFEELLSKMIDPHLKR